jgi:hypothetical protein
VTRELVIPTDLDIDWRSQAHRGHALVLAAAGQEPLTQLPITYGRFRP